MRQLLAIAGLMLAMAMSALAQSQQMSPDDQGKFNSYYSRWQQYRQTDNRNDMVSMEQRMQDLMAKYGIPSSTPYDMVVSQSGYPAENRDDRDRNYDRNSDRDRGYPGLQGGMSPEDQRNFNKEYQKWQESMAKHDRDDVEKHARKMEEIMARCNISRNTPFDSVATTNGYSRQSNYEDFRGRLSPDDQNRFDKEYQHWLNDRRKNDRDDIAKDEGKMQEIMARYNIPRDVPYNAIASGPRY